MTSDLLLALTAGMLAAVNPCGFALLPAYLSLLIVDADDAGRGAAVRRALVSTGCLTLGFVGVFAVFGLIVAPVAAGVQQYLPYVTVILGILLVLAGGWLLAGRSLPAFGWSPRGPQLRRRAGSMIGFGASYALASLTCTVAPFLAVVVTSLRSGSVLSGLALFVAYGLGMGLLVGGASLAVALAQQSLIDRLRRVGGLVPRLAGALLVMVGAYVAYYGWWELRVLAGGSLDDPVITAAAGLQGRLSAAIATLGVNGLVIIAAVLLALGVVIAARRAVRRRPRRPIHPASSDGSTRP